MHWQSGDPQIAFDFVRERQPDRKTEQIALQKAQGCLRLRKETRRMRLRIETLLSPAFTHCNAEDERAKIKMLAEKTLCIQGDKYDDQINCTGS